LLCAVPGARPCPRPHTAPPYARIVHATTLDHRGYAFPYDDVAPTGGAAQSGAVSSGSPSLLTVTLGPVH
jgi:hypothetical protein